MRIGVIFAAYNCEEFIDSCLSPWFKMRDSFDLVLTVTSGRFSDYQKLGIPNKNKETLKKLVSWDFDYLSITGGDKLLDEDTSRNRCLDYLKPYNCDLIWLVDLDEIYTCEQITSVINYVNSNPEINNFWINFKNYTIKYPLFLSWKRPTLYRNKIRGGIKNFYFDSYFSYNDGSNIENENSLTVPKEIAFIDHFSWTSRDAVRDKIQYQNGRFAGNEGERCSYIYDQDKGLDFNLKFWSSRNLEVPILHETIGPHCTDFDLSVSRRNRNIDIFNVSQEGQYEFFVYSSGGDLLHQSILNLCPGINYFIYPGEIIEPNFFRIVVLNRGEEVHDEKLHLSI